jgi:hypothetical protein
MVAAVDVAALSLLDLPSLVALVLGVLHEEFFWISKTFPHVFGVSFYATMSFATTSIPNHKPSILFTTMNCLLKSSALL